MRKQQLKGKNALRFITEVMQILTLTGYRVQYLYCSIFWSPITHFSFCSVVHELLPQDLKSAAAWCCREYHDLWNKQSQFVFSFFITHAKSFCQALPLKLVLSRGYSS